METFSLLQDECYQDVYETEKLVFIGIKWYEVDVKHTTPKPLDTIIQEDSMVQEKKLPVKPLTTIIMTV